MGEAAGFRGYMSIYDESVWATRPGSPTRVHMPLETIDLMFRPENRRSNVFAGVLPPKHSKNFRGMVTGSIGGPLLAYVKSTRPLAKHLIDWGMPSGNATYLPSIGGDWYEGETGELGSQFNGLRCNTFTVSGTEDSGRIDFAAEVMGESEDPKSSSFLAIPDDMEMLSDFDFDKVIFTIDSVEVLISQFSIKQTNGVKAKYMNVPGGTPARLFRSMRTVEIQVTPIRDDYSWDTICQALGSSDHDISIKIAGYHNGTGTAMTDLTTATFATPRANYVNHARQGGREELLMNQLNFFALKPDSASDILTTTWAEE